MNKTETRLTLIIQKRITHTGEYEELRDKEIEDLESNGWNVDIEDEEDV